VYQQAQQTKALQTCDNCKPFYERYDCDRIIRAYLESGKESARIIVSTKRIDKDNQHCFLRIRVSGKILPIEDLAFKSDDEALKAGKARVNELLGEGVVFEELTIENPNDPTEQLKLVAGVRKT
jgi:hypothetical protein